MIKGIVYPFEAKSSQIEKYGHMEEIENNQKNNKKIWKKVLICYNICDNI